MGVCHVPSLATAADRCTRALSMRGIEACPDVPFTTSRTRRGTFSVVVTSTTATPPFLSVARPPSGDAEYALTEGGRATLQNGRGAVVQVVTTEKGPHRGGVVGEGK